MSLVTYAPEFAFLGFYITRPDLRGHGIGHALWQHVLATSRAQTIGLDGVPDQQDNYRKSGFVLAHRNIRFGGVLPEDGVRDTGIVPIEPSDTDALSDYDRTCFPAPRRRFLESWLSTDGHVGLMVREGSNINGYGVIRPCLDGHKIGPLFAETTDIAESLLRALARHAAGGMIFNDPPEPNTDAVELCGRLGLKPVFETARMYRGTAPELPLFRTFGISTFELG